MKDQRGGFLMGMIVGLVLGLAIALAVAVYVTKVPVPFVNKMPQRTAEQDAAETARNQGWDANASLAGKNPARTTSSVSGVLQTAPANPATTASPTATQAAGSDGKAASAKSGTLAAAPPPASSGAPTAPAAAVAPSAPAAPEVSGYSVQAGAFAKREDAEQQRGKLAMLGYESKVVERDQGGKIIYRVRCGPFEKKELADDLKAKLDAAGIQSTLIAPGR